MKPCRILVAGPYADYQGSGTNRKVRVHSVGDIVLFPPDYATWLENHDMVKIADQVAGQDLEVDTIEIDESETVEILPAADLISASDSAIEFAADHEVDLKLVVDRATGSDGRILLKDVRKYMDEQSGGS